MNARWLLARHLAGPAVTVVRKVVGAAVPDVVKVAALVEIAGAAAAMARTIVKLRHIDPAAVDAYVSDPVDARATLGRGRWLPTMVRHVPTAPSGPAPVLAPVVPLRPVPARRRSSRRGGPASGQPGLFSVTEVRGGGLR